MRNFGLIKINFAVKFVKRVKNEVKINKIVLKIATMAEIQINSIDINLLSLQCLMPILIITSYFIITFVFF